MSASFGSLSADHFSVSQIKFVNILDVRVLQLKINILLQYHFATTRFIFTLVVELSNISKLNSYVGTAKFPPVVLFESFLKN